MRYVLGPAIAFTVAAPVPAPPAPPAVPPKADIAVTIVGLVGDVLTVAIPAYDLATCNKLCELYAFLLPEGQAAPTDAAGYVASPLQFSGADVSAVQTGTNATLTLPGGTPGSFLVQTILGFDQ